MFSGSFPLIVILLRCGGTISYDQ